MAGAHISMTFGFRGPIDAHATACASGAHAIATAWQWIQLGMAEVVVAGGTESCVEDIAVAGFCR